MIYEQQFHVKYKMYFAVLRLWNMELIIKNIDFELLIRLKKVMQFFFFLGVGVLPLRPSHKTNFPPSYSVFNYSIQLALGSTSLTSLFTQSSHLRISFRFLFNYCVYHSVFFPPSLTCPHQSSFCYFPWNTWSC